MDVNETYKKLLEELYRLTNKEFSQSDRHMIFQRYIYDRIPDEEMSKALKGKMKQLITVSLPDGLQIEPILKQTLKILALMEVSDNWQEFENLANKKKKPDKPKELTDFDKILKGIFQVPKPKEEPPE
ncbi:hypothetical protein [Taibaiella koreensis]|uniref:hypothetical protein n=1 Tax=Taibaiella koreensis TaxID=1268548 RepID=UPI000E5998B0|nr:hypothetical protein [Taibaiella koreensis]